MKDWMDFERWEEEDGLDVWAEILPQLDIKEEK